MLNLFLLLDTIKRRILTHDTLGLGAAPQLLRGYGSCSFKATLPLRQLCSDWLLLTNSRFVFSINIGFFLSKTIQ